MNDASSRSRTIMYLLLIYRCLYISMTYAVTLRKWMINWEYEENFQTTDLTGEKVGKVTKLNGLILALWSNSKGLGQYFS
jgi:hypothetical protein